MPACGGELHGLAAGRGAKIERGPAIARSGEARGQARSDVLDPPAALVIAGEVDDAAASGDADMAGLETLAAQPLCPCRAVLAGLEAEVDRWWRGNRAPCGVDGVRSPAPQPALGYGGGQMRQFGQLRALPHRAAENRVYELAGAAVR